MITLAIIVSVSLIITIGVIIRSRFQYQKIKFETRLTEAFKSIQDQAEKIRNFNLMIDEQKRQIQNQAETARSREKSAVVKSRIIHVAKISEQFAPLLPEFPNFNMKDVQWVGGTVDMIVWDGLEDGRDLTVVLLDIKTGNATTSPRQKAIREAVEAGRVKFEVVRIPATRELPASRIAVSDNPLPTEVV